MEDERAFLEQAHKQGDVAAGLALGFINMHKSFQETANAECLEVLKDHVTPEKYAAFCASFPPYKPPKWAERLLLAHTARVKKYGISTNPAPNGMTVGILLSCSSGEE